MQGIKDFNFPKFDSAAEELRKMGHEVFNPAARDIKVHGEVFDSPTGDLKDITPRGFDLRKALAADTAYICLRADAIALLPGWENSKGARAEHALAVALGLVIFYPVAMT